MGGIRDVIIDGSQEIYCQNYSKIELPFRRAQANGIFLAASPRICIEALAMIFIASAAFFFSKEPGGIGQAIPTLAAIALAAQRLLPIFQQAYSSFIGIKNNEASLRSLLSLLNKSTSNLIEQPKFRGGIPFDNEISFNSVGFKYHDKLDFVFKDINFTIRKGSRIGLMGASGSGKSTLLDILMGLLQPTQGSLEVDGVKIADENRTAWQSNIAHVPQSIFLTDSSIEENIAFGVPKDKINHPLLWEVARQAQLQETIEKLPNQYQTLVGERGVFLSGGQRQRIGIARALYKRADVIIFDEATSALDNETERHVMNSIDSLSKDLTIIICAHRKATLTGCDQIIELNGGNIFYA
jgi:ATP-binding cassette subfamily B protein